MLLPWMSRVARSKPLPCISSSISAPATARPLSSTQRQRRYSSSKPSSPSNDGSRPISAPTEAPTKGATPSVRKRASSKVGRPRSKDGLAKSVTASQVYDLPSVPSTQHLNRQGKMRKLYAYPQLTDDVQMYILRPFSRYIDPSLWFHQYHLLPRPKPSLRYSNPVKQINHVPRTFYTHYRPRFRL